MKFVKAKMVARLTAEGKANMIDGPIEDIMNKLDGKEVVKNDFKALVYDQEEYFVSLDGEYYVINKNDCE